MKRIYSFIVLITIMATLFVNVHAYTVTEVDLTDYMTDELIEKIEKEAAEDSSAPVPKPTQPVSSESPSAWATEAVNRAIELKLVPENLQNGYTKTITRAEYCALAVTLYETRAGTEIVARKQFSDTKDTNVEKMGGLEVVQGVGNDMFAPNDLLTREQAAVMLSKLAEVVGKPLEAKSAEFSDNSSISSWALESVGKVQAAGVMSGTGNNMFTPKGNYTREQSIITIHNIWEMQ